MSYSVLRRQTGEIVIVAKERISALLDVIGECEELLVIKGSLYTYFLLSYLTQQTFHAVRE